MRTSFQYFIQGLKLSLGILAIFSFIVFFNQFKLSHQFPIKHVQVYGLEHTSQKDIESLMTPFVTRGFFGVNVETIRNRLLHLPWVEKTAVRRVWPDAVEVRIVEKKPVAVWNDQCLLSNKGKLFYPQKTSYPENLPIFKGPEGRQVFMLKYFNEMHRLMAPLHAKIISLELSSYSTWKLALDNGVILRTAHQEVLTRLDHFVKVYAKIVGNRASDVEYIDLRYSNGVAVKWKTPVNKT